MKAIALFAVLFLSQIVCASEPPANYPIVKGEIRKIEVASHRISVKHGEIPNLDMPPMTMSFLVQNPQMLNGLSVGDKINFVVDEVDGDLTILWLEKVTPQGQISPDFSCLGVAPTYPRTTVEIEIRPGRSSTIRYEYAEGPYQGTSHINSLGVMNAKQEGNHFLLQSGEGKLVTELEYIVQGQQIADAYFSQYSSGMHQTPVHCKFED